MKRWSKLRAKVGELKVQYGKLGQDSPDIIYSSGDNTSGADRRFLYYMFFQGHYSPIKKEFGHSLYKELEARGYDLTTLKFSIQKKQTITSEGK